MLTLDNHIKITPELLKESNICSHFSDDDLGKIGNAVYDSYERDEQSRDGWYRRTEAAMDLAMQMSQQKSYPWVGAANIAFPLVTIAAMQFHSRAYPAIVNGRRVVETRVLGPDPNGTLRARADKISEHMSWQLLEQDENWEPETDRALINVPIVGVAFKKSYYNPSKGHNVSELVLARDLVVNYWAKTIEDARSKTHVLTMYRNDIRERVLRKMYRDILDADWFKADPAVFFRPNDDRQRDRAGTEEPQSSMHDPFHLLEQHCWFDLDDDGYEEPYIITIEEGSRQVLRIVPRFDRIEDVEYDVRKRIIKITATEYFTKIPFIPSPDGSLMDIGFGTLLGPINEAVSSGLNQLFDAGTMANTAGGFLGRGAKIRGGEYTFDPFQWNRVDATGDDLRKSIFPLPVREPSGVMFQLIGFLVEYANRIVGATDMMVGENPGQNTPAETSRTMIQQGSKVYSAIFKRIWVSMKQEFKKLYTLNAINLPETTRFGASSLEIGREDYSAGALAVIPTADPLITSDGERFAQAMAVSQRAGAVAGYNGDAVERMILSALKVQDIDTVFPGAESMGPAPTPERIQIQQMKSELGMAQLENTKMQFLMQLQSTAALNQAKIMEIEAKIFKLYEEGKAESEKTRINAFNASIQAMREENNQFNNQLQMILEGMSDATQSRANTGRGNVPLLEGPSGNQNADAMGLVQEGGSQGTVGEWPVQ